MFKLTTTNGPRGESRVSIEGRLDGGCVEAATRAVDAARRAAWAVVLDLGGVDFAEPGAVRWLQTAVEQGMRVGRGSCFLQELIKV